MNWWLMALSFVLGVVITLAFQIRRVTREVPVGATAGAAGAAGTTAATAETAVQPEPAKFVEAKADSAPNVETTETTETVVAAAAPAPHGEGSATPNEDGTGPDGWTVKGNEESMLYHSTESPSYAVTRAEVWFRDVETAEKAGFNRWDSGKSQRGLK